ncbi:histidine kinase [Leptobacterium sp. I13]|uniref:histidine kinase n=1 Tax=Leptobacterium meishanense TaxID=3128904 RepID=UPI0030EBE86B
MKKGVYIAFLFIPFWVFSQEASPVSNKSGVREPSQEAHKQFIDSANFYKKKDIAQSIGFIEKSLTVLGRQKNSPKTAVSYTTLGDIYTYWKQYDLAIANYEIALHEQSAPEIKIKLGNAYYLNKQNKKSLAIYQELINDNSLSAYQSVLLYEGLGDVYRSENDIGKAISNYEQALRIAQDNLITPKTIDLNSKLAAAYAKRNDLDQAQNLYDNSLQLASKQNPRRAIEEKERVADFYKNRNLYDKEIAIRQSALEDAKKLKRETAPAPASVSPEEDTITPQRINYKIAGAYIAQNKYEEAIPYLEESIAEADDEEDLVVQKDATRQLSEIYRTVGNYDKALASYQNYVQLVDELYIKKEEEITKASQFSRNVALNQNRIASLEKDRELSESKYELAIKERALISESNKRQQFIIYALILGLLLLLSVIILFYRSNRQQKLTNNLLSLKSLRSQMNPHFIFNALNSVNNFIAKNDERSANRYLSEFSALMRSVLENSEEDFIPLAKEIELLKLYTKLEHSRFMDKFDYDIQIDANVAIASFQIPPMLLQPYIENAIWHGLRYKESKGNLKIHFSQSNPEEIRVIIEDDGIGRKKSTELKTKNQKKQQSKGMGNIKKRIAILNDMYKNKVSVRIEDVFEDGTGTRVILTLRK